MYIKIVLFVNINFNKIISDYSTFLENKSEDIQIKSTTCFN